MVEEYPLPEQLSREEAIARLRELTEYWRRYGVSTLWDGDCGRISGRVLGIRFTGTFSVEDRRVRGELQAGFLGARLGGRRYVLRKLAHYLDPTRPLAELHASRR